MRVESLREAADLQNRLSRVLEVLRKVEAAGVPVRLTVDTQPNVGGDHKHSYVFADVTMTRDIFAVALRCEVDAIRRRLADLGVEF